MDVFYCVLLETGAHLSFCGRLESNIYQSILPYQTQSPTGSEIQYHVQKEIREHLKAIDALAQSEKHSLKAANKPLSIGESAVAERI